MIFDLKTNCGLGRITRAWLNKIHKTWVFDYFCARNNILKMPLKFCTLCDTVIINITTLNHMISWSRRTYNMLAMESHIKGVNGKQSSVVGLHVLLNKQPISSRWNEIISAKSHHSSGIQWWTSVTIFVCRSFIKESLCFYHWIKAVHSGGKAARYSDKLTKKK